MNLFSKIIITITLFSILITGCNKTVIDPDADKTAEVSETIDTSISTPQFAAYTPELHEQLDGKAPYAIFFHAVWCPQCVILERLLLSGGLLTLPQNTVILRADFDEETELKKRYQVNLQSTFVLINEDGSVFRTLPFTAFGNVKGTLMDQFNIN